MRITKTHKKIITYLPLLLSLLLLNLCKEEPFEPEVTGSIKGKVKDAVTSEPISNVTISTKPSTEVVITDSAGYYKITGIDTGRYSLTAEKTNYQTKLLGVKVKKNETHQVNFLLNKANGDFQSDIRFKNNFTPHNGAEDQPSEMTLSWNAVQDDSGDSLTYDVQILNGTTMKEVLRKENVQDSSLTVSNLNFDQIYYWQVIARSVSTSDTTHSKMLSFSTREITGNAFFFVKRIEGDYELMAYDLNLSRTSRLTYNNYRDWAPKANPKTGKIAFVSNSKVKPFLYTMDNNGSNIRQITDIGVDGFHNQGDAFAWDEDEGKIVFSHYQHLYEVNADGTSLQKITTAPSGRHFREVDLSPGNSKIVALTIDDKVYNSEIYLMDRDGSNKEVLIDSLKGIVASPTFSIDGNAILYTHDISGNESLEGRMLNSHIFRLDLASRDTTDLSTNKPLGTNDLSPTYSPTGNKILFTNVVNDQSEPKEIWMMNIDGTNREKVIEEAELPSWN